MSEKKRRDCAPPWLSLWRAESEALGDAAHLHVDSELPLPLLCVPRLQARQRSIAVRTSFELTVPESKLSLP